MHLVLPKRDPAPTIEPGMEQDCASGELIVRVLIGRVDADHVLPFREQTRRALADAEGHGGFLHAHVGRQSHKDGSEEIVVVTVWEDLESVYRWVGGTDLLDTPVITGVDRDLFVHCDIQHYETLDAVMGEGAFAALPGFGSALEP